MNDLFEAARQAFERAYAPYTPFPVGAAVRTPSGRIYAGANVQNAASPIGNCAEASAIAAMVAAGEREIVECVVVAGGERLCTPCGGCRQRLAEFAGPDLPIHIFGPEGFRRTFDLGTLLPHMFSLDRPKSKPETERDGEADTAIDVIRKRAPKAAPRLGLILGSGLGGFADTIEGAIAISYEDLPGFPRPSVEGHGGRFVVGTVGGLPIACLQGRVHLYEGKPASATKIMIRTLRALGCETLIVTNAAGSLRPDVGPGSLVLIEDHINMLGQNPLTGPAVGTASLTCRRLMTSAVVREFWRSRRERRLSLRPGSISQRLGRASRRRLKFGRSRPWAPIWWACPRSPKSLPPAMRAWR